MNFWLALLRGAAALLGLLGHGAGADRSSTGCATLDPLYNFLLTFGLTLILQDLVQAQYGSQSQPYPPPAGLAGTVDLGLFDFPAYQVFVLGLRGGRLRAWCGWLLTRTRVGMVVRAATERPELTRALGHQRRAAGSRRSSASASRWPGWPGCSPRRCGRSTR